MWSFHGQSSSFSRVSLMRSPAIITSVLHVFWLSVLISVSVVLLFHKSSYQMNLSTWRHQSCSVQFLLNEITISCCQRLTVSLSLRVFRYYRGTHGVIVVYDVTSAESFVNVKRWLHEINQNCDDVCRILGERAPSTVRKKNRHCWHFVSRKSEELSPAWFRLSSLRLSHLRNLFLFSVGNKNDDPNSKVVETTDAQKFAEQMGINLFETSAKENINVEEVTRTVSLVCLQTNASCVCVEASGICLVCRAAQLNTWIRECVWMLCYACWWADCVRYFLD